MINSTLCYIERDDCYLMLFRDKKDADPCEGKWVGVGGKFEPGETPDECLLREVYEETGLRLTKYRFHGVISFLSDRWPEEDMYLYTATEWEGELVDCSEGELVWIPKRAVLGLRLWEGDVHFIRRLIAGDDAINMTCVYEGHHCVSVTEGCVPRDTSPSAGAASTDLSADSAAIARDIPFDRRLSAKRLFLLDMDGTIYLSDRLFDGTLDFLDYVKRIGGRCVFLTNNSSRGTDAYIAKLARMGIEARPEDFLTSADVTIDLLKDRYEPGQTYFVCGTESFKSQLRAAGLHVLEAGDVRTDTLREDFSPQRKGGPTAGPAGRAALAGDVAGSAAEALPVVLLGYDTELNYEKLETCCILLNRGSDYIATHPDLVCPTWYGSAPDCGSVIAMLKTATGREPLVIGKPEPAMALAAMKRFGYRADQTCLVGDRLYTDIACGIHAGIDTVFVLSGEGTREDIAKYGLVPSWIFEDIKTLYHAIIKETEL